MSDWFGKCKQDGAPHPFIQRNKIKNAHWHETLSLPKQEETYKLTYRLKCKEERQDRTGSSCYKKQYNFPLLLKEHFKWTMNIIECASLNARFTKRRSIGYRPLPHLSNCQSIDFKSILTNKKATLYLAATIFDWHLPIIITCKRQLGSPLIFL